MPRLRSTHRPPLAAAGRWVVVGLLAGLALLAVAQSEPASPPGNTTRAHPSGPAYLDQVLAHNGLRRTGTLEALPEFIRGRLLLVQRLVPPDKPGGLMRLEELPPTEIGRAEAATITVGGWAWSVTSVAAAEDTFGDPVYVSVLRREAESGRPRWAVLSLTRSVPERVDLELKPFGDEPGAVSGTLGLPPERARLPSPKGSRPGDPSTPTPSAPPTRLQDPSAPPPTTIEKPKPPGRLPL